MNSGRPELFPAGVSYGRGIGILATDGHRYFVKLHGGSGSSGSVKKIIIVGSGQ